ncbi:hypothetical protein Mpop_2733 [Methylorubrum populi BJ001]|jgi:hypothetical protein|uniref:Uncharacterized protein n=1 Tax=Methylorubrum populi (strain ATCC BAA-705 / NCIMB 13946 / BJ001) TaxID=441620 RepID=B1ZD19_METPB|nr:hypothetical protein [Methylorubrum populi]ACB80888.1 hypothetical protein Mpop_2733 [Methylorubrum populi BJ001]
MKTQDQPLHRFDGTIAWSGLPVEAQFAIGAIALEIAQAWKIQHAAVTGGAVPKVIERAADAADALLIDQLMDVVAGYLPAQAQLSPDRKTLRIPSLLGGVCRRCGGSQNDACQPHSCAWVAEDLCSECATAEEWPRHG